jgi:hypothetical protein
MWTPTMFVQDFMFSKNSLFLRKTSLTFSKSSITALPTILSFKIALLWRYRHVKQSYYSYYGRRWWGWWDCLGCGS